MDGNGNDNGSGNGVGNGDDSDNKNNSDSGNGSGYDNNRGGKDSKNKLLTKLIDTTELISTRHDRLSFALGYSKGLSIKLWIFYKQKDSITLELLGFS